MSKVGRWNAAVVWFRRDLRLSDHPALSEALERARLVVPLFVLDERLLEAASPARAWYLRGALLALDAALRERGSGLLVGTGRPEEVVPAVARASGADVVVAIRDVTPFSYVRDRAVASALEQDGRRLALRPGLLLAEPETLQTASGEPYRVFTPFWRALQASPRRPLRSAPGTVPTSPTILGPRDDRAPAPAPLPGLPPPGESAALERLTAWVSDGLAGYGPDRDMLAGSGTSHLGADLHFGTLSPLQVETAALESGLDATPFIRQLAWREFYHHQLFHRRQGPAASSHPLMAVLRSEADDPAAVDAWREGRTGIPTVDAAMRQLGKTGWISNRARLVTASFLTKHLLMDYRIGERHFMRHLLDGDVANNRGGWQWIAGVGADAQPWFRIFNPVRQGQRFDADGRWVRRWIPQLADVPDGHVHEPWRSPSPPAGYQPIVDLAQGRERALAAFRSMTGG